MKKYWKAQKWTLCKGGMRQRAEVDIQTWRLIFKRGAVPKFEYHNFQFLIENKS